MNIDRFAEQLPSLYEGWGEADVRPRSPIFADALSNVRGMTAPCVLQLLNAAVACLEGDEAYAEVGSYQGSTLIGALLGHPDKQAFATDNFREYDPHGKNRERLFANLAQYGLTSQVCFHEQHFEEFLLRMRAQSIRFGVYFYDGAHDYRSQLMGLMLAMPLLSDRALLIVDDANWSCVRQATFDFLARHPETKLLFDLPTPANCHPTFWNGLLVLGWDAGRCTIQ